LLDAYRHADTLGARVHSRDDAAGILDVFQGHGHSEIDTARLYGAGSSEEMLADLAWQNRGLVMGTKLYPNYRWAVGSTESYTHKPEDVRRGLINSLKALKCDKIDLFYLHGPDRNTSFEETLREVNELHKEGLFNRWGVSNYFSWEVASMSEICIKNSWVKPSVYQGVYSALQRSIEAELVPCLRHYGISIYAFQPLAGGFLTGRYQRNQSEFEPGSRFDPNHSQGTLHHNRYWNDSYFDALDVLRKAGENHGLTVGEISLRWLKHHSELKQALNDAIIVGASSTKHLEQNLVDLEKGPLPDDVVQAIENAWLKVKAVAPKYWH
jgi:aflatoxin B1 aldehyde reductase